MVQDFGMSKLDLRRRSRIGHVQLYEMLLYCFVSEGGGVGRGVDFVYVIILINE